MGGQGENFDLCLTIFLTIVVIIGSSNPTPAMSPQEKRQLRDKTVEMFNHAYGAYMDKAYPADELMPLSCKGRYRGSEPSRGDIDDTLGNFTLTLIDSLDTLAIMGDIDEFERAVRLVVSDARFDADTIVSVFETNIRILGGLLGGHVAAIFFKNRKRGMDWYQNELLTLAKEVGDRLLPAFNTSTGIPYPRINLKHGITTHLASNTRDTCTSCAGTMILEFAALSRLTGIAVYEEKAHKAMDYLWSQRHRTSDLMGTVINLHNGDWIRRESGVGAGIDSYYEYVLKAYILLGDNTYLARFNKHYNAVKKYIRQGPLLVDVHMHKPTSASRNFMDALLAFWPGLQVMVGDIGSAVETHEMLYQVVQRHNFLPEAFTTDFRVHWAQHPLRPEFLESTYFLYEATWDPYYLEVGKRVLNNLEEHARVECGFAAIKDLKRGTLEDQMDSFVLAETFKYLFLLFSDKDDLAIDVNNFVFTTEAHLLPLSLSVGNYSWKNPTEVTPDIHKLDMMSVAEMTKTMEDDVGGMYRPTSSHSDDNEEEEEEDSPGTCRNYQTTLAGGFAFVRAIRAQLRDLVDSTHPKARMERPRLKATEFVAGNKEHMDTLRHMGIRVATMPDGRIQLLHTASDALSQDYADAGLEFMQEMIELSKMQKQDSQHEPMYVKLISPPFNGLKAYRAGPAQFGYDLNEKAPVRGNLAVAEPVKACTPIQNGFDLLGRIAVLERGECMFVEKARNLQKSGAIGGIVLDSSQGTSSQQLSLFAMSGDGTQDVGIPMVFVFHQQGQELMANLRDYPDLEIELTSEELEDEDDDESKADIQQTRDVPATASADGATASPFSDSSSTPVVGGGGDGISSTQPHGFQETQFSQSSSSSSSSAKVPPPSTLSSAPLSKLEHGFYYREFVDISTDQYFLQCGSKFLHINLDVHLFGNRDSADSTTATTGTSASGEDQTRMKYEPMPDGSKMFTFYLRYPKIAGSDGSGPGSAEQVEKPVLNEMYLDVIHAFQHRTNLDGLPAATSYMNSLARFMESAYFQLNRVDRPALEAMQEFAALVTVKQVYPDGKQVLMGRSPHLDAHDGGGGGGSAEASAGVVEVPQIVAVPPKSSLKEEEKTSASASSTNYRGTVKISVKTDGNGNYKAVVEEGAADQETLLNAHNKRRGDDGDAADSWRLSHTQGQQQQQGLPRGPESRTGDNQGDSKQQLSSSTSSSSSTEDDASPALPSRDGSNSKEEL